ncbi:hypothetical protein GIX45_25340 [Erwinia sp. CPCC 100877]|nr:hypothetical protein [Erwinia sp. CPCC 100877]
MMTLLFLLGFIGLIAGIFLIVKNRRHSLLKKRALLLTGASFLLIVVSAAFIEPTPKLVFTDDSVETNEKGLAIIKGETNEQSTITVDGEKVKSDGEHFTYKVTLKDDQPKKLTFVASIGSTDKAETIEVKPSKKFISALNKNADKQKILDKAKSALATAENNPTQKNYDEAATLIASLDREQADLTKRLAIVKENIPIYAAVALAEEKQTKEQFDTASALIKKEVTLNRTALNKRLTLVQQKITEKETQEKQLSDARQAVEKAEQEPTDEHYSQALAKIKELPNGSSELDKRIKSVKQLLTAQKEAAKQEAEAQRQAQEAQKAAEAQAAQEAAESPAATPESGTMVLITQTGKKYHTHKCGNGDYYSATLEEAQRLGLTPCAKCYP